MTELTTLSRLLSSQEVRDAAPCVPVTHDWILRRDGTIVCAAPLGELVSEFRETGKAVTSFNRLVGDCIWSGDLSALLADAAGLEAKLARAREGLEELKEYGVFGAQNSLSDVMGKKASTTLQELDQ